MINTTRFSSPFVLALFVSLAACSAPQHTETTVSPAPESSAPPAPSTGESADAANVESTDASAVSETALDASSAAPTAMDASTAIASDASAAPDARSTTRTGTTHTGTGTTTATAATTTTATPSGNVASGRTAFQSACNRCHPNGDADTGPRINGLNWNESRMRDQIRHGGGSMRAIPVTRLSDAALTDLIAYLRTTHAVR